MEIYAFSLNDYILGPPNYTSYQTLNDVSTLSTWSHLIVTNIFIVSILNYKSCYIATFTTINMCQIKKSDCIRFTYFKLGTPNTIIMYHCHTFESTMSFSFWVFMSWMKIEFGVYEVYINIPHCKRRGLSKSKSPKG